MSTNLFLTEGAIAGHMSHLYDNRDLTFAKLKKIFTAASNGELEGTEKTDGQNLYISYSAKRGLRGAAKGSRNKGHIKSGGLDPKQLYDFFEAAHPGKELSNAFSDALSTFERSVKALDRETQIAIFGEDNNIYYNAEVMDKRTPNVIEYDTKSLVIHRAGHGEFDKETGAKTDRNISINAKALDAALPVMQQATDKEEYTVHVNAMRTLEALEDDRALNIALGALNALQSATGVSDRATITQYMIARIAPLIAELFRTELSDIEVDVEIQKDVVAWFLGAGVGLTQIKSNFDKEDRGRVSELLKGNKKTILQQAIEPLEGIVHDFSVEMIRGLESAFILDNRAEVDRLQQELRSAIQTIQNTNDAEEIEVLMRQMKKLKKIENFATASEGFVFEFEGMTYKFTGNFAPANQILGIAKYGQSAASSGVVGESEAEVEPVEAGKKFSIALFPGAFKPPHRGHLQLVEHLSTIADRVIILMSPLPRLFPNQKDEMTYDAAHGLWKEYLKNANQPLTNVSIIESPVNSPVGATYNFVSNEDDDPNFAQVGESVLAVSGDKDDDASRFNVDLQKHAREGVTTETMAMPVVLDSAGRDMQASIMRKAIEDGDIATFTDYLPDGLKGNAEILIKKLTPKRTESISEMIFRMINEAIDENTMAGGSVEGAAGSSFGKPNTTNVWKSKDDDEEEDDEEDTSEITEKIFKRLLSPPYQNNKGSKSNVH